MSPFQARAKNYSLLRILSRLLSKQRLQYLVEVRGCNLPGLAGEVDVVRVVHLAQVVEAAPLQLHIFSEHGRLAALSNPLCRQCITCFG